MDNRQHGLKRIEQRQGLLSKFVNFFFPKQAEPDKTPKKKFKQGGGGGCFGKPAWMRSERLRGGL